MKQKGLPVNSHQAQQVLLAYRPGIEVDDPEIAQALDLADKDPDLRRWLDQHCAFQQALCERVRQIALPEGLAEQIISERKSYLARQVKRRRLPFAAAVPVLVILF